jgi:hypothetical protein
MQKKKKTEPHSTLIDKLRQVTGLNVEPESVKHREKKTFTRILQGSS